MRKFRSMNEAAPRPSHRCKCGRSFSLTRNYNYHRKWECGKVIKCHFCQKRYTKYTTLQGHFRTHPTHGKAQKRLEKGDRANNQMMVTDAAESNDRVFCTCGRSYSSRYHLTYHQKWECGKPMECHVCVKSFTIRSHWLKHFRDNPDHALATKVDHQE